MISRALPNFEEPDVDSETLPWVMNHPESKEQEKRVRGAGGLGNLYSPFPLLKTDHGVPC